MARDKTRMSKDVTKDGPEKSTVGAGQMRSAQVHMVDSALRLGNQYRMTMVLDMLGTWEPEFVITAPGDCATCGEGSPRYECPMSQRPCGHHCNCSWETDHCCWCKREMRSDG